MTCTILLLLFCFTNSSFAQTGTAGSFLRLGVGARAKAMGDAYTAIATGIEASYYNPAALPFLNGKEVLISYRALSLGRSFTVVGFGVPIRPQLKGTSKKVIQGGFSLTWIRASVGNIDGRNSDGGSTGEFSNSENAFVFSFALHPAEMLSLGLSVKVLWNRFTDVGTDAESVSASGVGFDFGAFLTPHDWVTVGFVLKDFNSKYRWNTGDIYGEDGAETINKLPRVFRAGVALTHPKFKNVTLAVDFEQFYRNKFFTGKIGDRIHIGAEGVIRENFLVRGGWDDGAVTLGGGYWLSLLGKKSQLSYAFRTPGNRPEEEHVFSWIFRF